MGFEGPETVSFMLGVGGEYIQLQHDHRGRESVSPLIASEDLSAPRYFQVGLIYGIWRVSCGAQDMNIVETAVQLASVLSQALLGHTTLPSLSHVYHEQTLLDCREIHLQLARLVTKFGRVI